MFRPCWTEKFWSWPKQQFIITEPKKMGRGDRKALVSFTCGIVMPSLVSAFFRNLQSFHIDPIMNPKKMVIYIRISMTRKHVNICMFIMWLLT